MSKINKNVPPKTNFSNRSICSHLKRKCKCLVSQSKVGSCHFKSQNYFFNAVKYPISNFQVDHGSTHSETRHAGDFGNIDVDSDGNGKIDLTIPAKSGSTLFGAEDQRILGRTLVIHELEDDLGTLSGSTLGTSF